MSGDLSSDRSAQFLKLIKKPHDGIVKARLQKRGGELVKDTGDGFLVAFKDAEKAVLCGVEIQESLTRAAIHTPLGQLRVRIGLSTGYGEPKNNDYISDAVNLASRVQKHCLPGQVYFSFDTYGLVEGKLLGLSFNDLGHLKVEGFGKQRLFSVLLD